MNIIINYNEVISGVIKQILLAPDFMNGSLKDKSKHLFLLISYTMSMLIFTVANYSVLTAKDENNAPSTQGCGLLVD